MQLLSSPVFLLGSTFATLWAAIFHLLVGNKWPDLVLYWFIGLVGFGVGQSMAEALGLQWMLVGQLHLVEGTLACWIAMVVARWIKL